MSPRTPITLIALFAATAIAGTAHAQPGSSEPPPASSSKPKTGLSHINGTPIKVGEHSQYYYDYKKFSISANPFGPILGYYDIAASVALSPHIALSGSLAVAGVGDDDGDSYTSLSLTAPIYFKKMRQSFYIEPGVQITTLGDGDGDTFAGPQILVGWHWSWDSGANVQFAFGAARGATDYDDDMVIPAGYFRVGYAF